MTGCDLFAGRARVQLTSYSSFAIVAVGEGEGRGAKRGVVRRRYEWADNTGEAWELCIQRGGYRGRGVGYLAAFRRRRG